MFFADPSNILQFALRGSFMSACLALLVLSHTPAASGETLFPWKNVGGRQWAGSERERERGVAPPLDGCGAELKTVTELTTPSSIVYPIVLLRPPPLVKLFRGLLACLLAVASAAGWCLSVWRVRTTVDFYNPFPTLSI